MIIKSIINIGWNTSHKVVKAVTGLFVGVLVARHLGPEQYGIIRYLMSLLALLAPFATMGIGPVITRQIVENTQNYAATLGTALLIITCGTTSISVIYLLSIYTLEENKVFVIFSCILASSYIFEKLSAVLVYYYRAIEETKYIAIPKITANIVSALWKIIAIYYDLDLLYFIVANLVEASIALLAFLCLRYYQNIKVIFNRTHRRVYSTLKESWPLIFVGFIEALYLKVDIFLIGRYMSMADVGTYSAAVRIVTILWGFNVMMAFALQPALFRYFKKPKNSIVVEMHTLLLGLVFCVCLLVSILLFFYSDKIIYILYGGQFFAAAEVLKIYCWTLVFVGLQVLRDIWLVNNGSTTLRLYCTSAGAVANLMSNLILIPMYGINGAAYSTILGLFVGATICNFAFKETRGYGKIQLRAMLILPVFKIFMTHRGYIASKL